VSSTGALSLDKVPETMTVIGAGVIGLELGSVYARLGTKVTVIEFLDRACPSMDAELEQSFTKILQKQGLVFKFGTKVTSGSVQNGKAVLKVSGKSGGAEETITTDVCLVAIGRKPYTTGLGCDKVGVKLDGKGRVEINDHFESNVKGIYAIGDVVSGPMLAHKSEEEGVALAELLAGKGGHINYNTIPSVIYTHPEVAWVGKNEEECKAAGKPAS
jgi:dihydrolipoamide dehydrogenase